MDSRTPHRVTPMTRRDWLLHAGAGFGALALGDLLARDLSAGRTRSDSDDRTPTAPWRRPATARSVIFLFMEGGPSHIDTFDPKPELNRLAGQPLPPSFKPVITPMGEGRAPLLASRRKWKQHGQSGLWVSDWLPHIADLRRRAGGDPLVLVQRPEPRRRRLPDEHRLDPGRPAFAGELGQLRPGHREREPARRSS